MRAPLDSGALKTVIDDNEPEAKGFGYINQSFHITQSFHTDNAQLLRLQQFER